MRLLLIVLIALLTGCASGPKFTVDDGRKVDETLLAGMRAYGAGERLIRGGLGKHLLEEGEEILFVHALGFFHGLETWGRLFSVFFGPCATVFLRISHRFHDLAFALPCHPC